MELKNVVLVDGARSAFARGGRGKLVATRLDTAGAQVVRALLDRNPKVKDTMIEDVGLGNVSGKGSLLCWALWRALRVCRWSRAPSVVIASAGLAWKPCIGL